MSIRAVDLDGLKLVEKDYFAQDEEVLNALESAYMQGSQGWGVTNEVRLILTLARDLKEALVLANVADENHRLLKGAQLALGREKKARELTKAALDSAMDKIGELTAERDEARAGRQELAEVLNAHTEENAGG